MTAITVTADDLDNWIKYQLRSERVHWYRADACEHSAGHDNATCVLTPDHPGPHMGNGFDTWGPKGPFRWEER